MHPMLSTTYDERRRLEQMGPDELAAFQLQRLNALLSEILPHNHFYDDKLAGVTLPLESLDALSDLPLTSKSELIRDGQEHQN